MRCEDLLKTTCGECGTTVPDSDDRCPTCDTAAEAPNVRDVSSPEEEQALESRYSEAVRAAEQSGVLPVLNNLQSALRNSVATIASDLYVIRQLLTSDKALYGNYFMAVNARMRKPAKLEDDTRRRVTDAIVFDGYSDRIIFAALSLDGAGLDSYGIYSMTLRDIAIRKRATVLEENSFSFVEKHCTITGGMPLGFRAVWDQRDKLGAVKLGSRLKPEMSVTDFPKLVLSTGSGKRSDDFMEVHIYRAFDGNAIQSVRGPKRPQKADERAVVRILKEVLASTDREWVDS